MCKLNPVMFDKQYSCKSANEILKVLVYFLDNGLEYSRINMRELGMALASYGDGTEVFITLFADKIIRYHEKPLSDVEIVEVVGPEWTLGKGVWCSTNNSYMTRS